MISRSYRANLGRTLSFFGEKDVYVYIYIYCSYCSHNMSNRLHLRFIKGLLNFTNLMIRDALINMNAFEICVFDASRYPYLNTKALLS